MKAIPVTCGMEIDRLLNHIARQAHRGTDYWYLVKRLKTAAGEYRMEMSQAPVFWGFTFNALREAVLSYLCRLYDQDPKALSLLRFLRTTQAYRGYFSVDQVRQRLQDSPSVDSSIVSSFIRLFLTRTSKACPTRTHWLPVW